MAATLVTIAVSHYCEKARWSLDRAGRPYVEKAYSPGAHRAATALHGGTSTPLLVTKDGVLKESTDIVRWADEGLFLAGDDAAAVAELVADFDARLGPATRALAYIYVTADTETFARVVTPGGEPTVASRALAMGIVPLMRRALGLNEPGAEANARATIDAVFADVADRLADGRRYLVGDTFSAADMTFAALAAPAVYLDDVKRGGGGGGGVPEGLDQVRKAYRETPAGAFVARMYKEERGEKGAAAVKEGAVTEGAAAVKKGAVTEGAA